MKKNISIIVLFLFSNICTFGQWTSLNSLTSVNLNSVSFTNLDTGYVGGQNGEIYKTTDGGNNWIAQTSGITDAIFSIFFTSDSIGYASAGNNTAGTILNTTDGGQNWNIQTTSTSPYLLEIFFVNDSVGFCVGYLGMILKTEDKGLNWISQNSGTSQNLRSVYFIDENTGFVAAEYNEILKTTDGGTTWNSYASGTSSILLSIFFVNANIGYAAGGNGTIVKTINGGITWSLQTSNTNEFLQSIYFVNTSIGYAVGARGVLSNTSDGGATWSSQYIGSFSGEYGWYCLTFVNNIGYAVGYEGNIAKTSCIPSLGTDTQTTCNSYTWIDGNTYTASNNTAKHTLTNAAGCDSLVTLDLTINSNTGTDIITACDSYTWIDGNTYTASNNEASHTLTNAAGCDSLVTLNLTINRVSDITTSLNVLTITANNKNATYQWLNCDDNYSPLAGETNQDLITNTNGQYAVEITEKGCKDTSDCVVINTVGLSDHSLVTKFMFYPNPVNEILNIDLGERYNEIFIQVLNTAGRSVINQTFVQKQLLELELNSLPDGIYYVNIRSEGKTATFKIVKKK